MTNEAEFEAKVGRMQDEDLVRIAFSKKAEGFLPEMIVAAKLELANRDVTNDEIEIVKDQAAKENEFMGKEDIEPLSNIAWVGFFLFGSIFLVSLPFVAVLFFGGQHKKAKQSLGAILAGLLFWSVILWTVFFLFS